MWCQWVCEPACSRNVFLLHHKLHWHGEFRLNWAFRQQTGPSSICELDENIDVQEYWFLVLMEYYVFHYGIPWIPLSTNVNPVLLRAYRMTRSGFLLHPGGVQGVNKPVLSDTCLPCPQNSDINPLLVHRNDFCIYSDRIVPTKIPRLLYLLSRQTLSILTLVFLSLQPSGQYHICVDNSSKPHSNAHWLWSKLGLVLYPGNVAILIPHQKLLSMWETVDAYMHTIL